MTEYYPFPGSPPQPVNSLLTPTTGHCNKLLPDIQQKFPTQQVSDVYSFSFIPPGSSIDSTVATGSYGIVKPNSYNFKSTHSSFETSNSLPAVKTFTESLHYPTNVESLTVVENFPPGTQTIHIDGYAPNANVADFYQTPITVQIPSMPQLSPFIGIASPLPEVLPSQNIMQEIYTPNVVPKMYPQTIETSMPVVPTTSNIPSSGIGCGSQQLPVVLQINMASPWGSEPVQAPISQPAPVPIPFPPFDPSFSMPPAPIIVLERSKSKLESLLPILLLSLIDGGFGNSDGGGGGSCGCCQCSAPIPVPFPVPIPFNNPVIIKKKDKKAPTDENS